MGCGEAAVGVPEYPVSLLGEAGHHHGSHADFDATMAQIDIEDFHSEDILLRLPPLCASDLQVSKQEKLKSRNLLFIFHFLPKACFLPTFVCLHNQMQTS